VALGRERLAARADRLPRGDAVLAPFVQRLDDLGERLRRGLGERIVVARQALQRDRARLSAPLLAARMAHARHRLDAQRLSPALIATRIAGGRERLDGLGRLMVSLNPDAVLERGYVRVTGADGRTLVSRAAAAQEAGLSLHFRDGELAVTPAGAPGSAPATAIVTASGAASAAPRPARGGPKDRPAPPEQGKLL
jgi:exodeoxyribonuclease VII large subunit